MVRSAEGWGLRAYRLHNDLERLDAFLDDSCCETPLDHARRIRITKVRDEIESELIYARSMEKMAREVEDSMARLEEKEREDEYMNEVWFE